MTDETSMATAAPVTSGPLIKDSSTAEFMADVVDASNEVPVIVDMWAPWCGPCKTLSPIIEKVVNDAGGAVRLVKIEAEVVELRGQLEALGAQRARLSASNERLAGADMEQTQQIDELSRENDQLKGDQRWPEWITGGAMVCVGMLLGALWSRSSGRRNSPRIRL